MGNFGGEASVRFMNSSNSDRIVRVSEVRGFTKPLNIRCSPELSAGAGSERIPACILGLPQAPTVRGFDSR